METIYADFSISMSEFKKNPAHVLRMAGEKPVAILNHNKPAFYMLTPKLFEALIDSLENRALTKIARRRLVQAGKAIEVDIDAI